MNVLQVLCTNVTRYKKKQVDFVVADFETYFLIPYVRNSFNMQENGIVQYSSKYLAILVDDY